MNDRGQAAVDPFGETLTIGLIAMAVYAAWNADWYIASILAGTALVWFGLLLGLHHRYGDVLILFRDKGGGHT